MKKISLLFALFLSIMSFAQEHTFKVLACKGNNAVKNNGSWNVVKAGEKLYDNNVIKVEKAGYIGLMHKSGKTLELKTEGEFNITELTSRIANKNNSSFTSKYASFVADNMNGSENGYNHKVTGSVTRGNPQMKFKIFAPEEFILIKDKPTTIAWDAPIEHKQAIVRVMNFYAQVVYEKEVSGFETLLDLSNTNVKAGENYILSIVDKNNEEIISKNIPFSLLAEDQTKKLNSELSTLENALDKESIMDQLLLASFYEDKGLSLYAAEALRKTVVKMPEIEDFKINYRNYLATKNVATPTDFKW